MTAFFAGCAVGALIAFVVLALAQSAGKQVPGFAAQDRAREETERQVDLITERKEKAHADIDKLTPDEIDLVLNGFNTVADVLRERERRAAAAGNGPGDGVTVGDPGKPADPV